MPEGECFVVYWATILSRTMKNQISVPGITERVGRRAFAGSTRVSVGRSSSDLAAPASVKLTPFPKNHGPVLARNRRNAYLGEHTRS
jgi:hypothetical protein